MASAGPGSSSAIVSVRNVHKTYRVAALGVRALCAVSFDIEPGEFVAIVGPSGSGKSTIMNLIGALDVPTSGDVWIAGHNIGALGEDALAAIRNRTIGFVFQHFHLLPRVTALQQVMLPLAYARPRRPDAQACARAWLDRVGLAHRLQHLPQQLSGGQQQRVAIARALVNNPSLLLADEPTGALDSQTADEIMHLLRTLNGQGVTVVVITHEADIARHAARQLVFRDGRLVQDVRQPAAPVPVPATVSA